MGCPGDMGGIGGVGVNWSVIGVDMGLWVHWEMGAHYHGGAVAVVGCALKGRCRVRRVGVPEGV